MEVFSNETGHKGGVQATVVTTYALKDNMYSEISPVAITMNGKRSIFRVEKPI